MRPLRWLILLVVLGGAVWAALPLPSRTLTFKEQNCACKIPYNWTLKDSPLFLVEAHRLFGGTFFIEAKPADPSFSVETPIFAEALKKKLISDGHEIVSENREPFQGHAAYAYTMRKTLNGKTIYTHAINFVAGGFRYDLLTVKADTEPMDDAQLRAAVDSFTLLDPASP